MSTNKINTDIDLVDIITIKAMEQVIVNAFIKVKSDYQLLSYQDIQ